MTKALADYPGKEARMLTVVYPPGADDPVHRHDARAFVYVLEGSIVMGVRGGKSVTLTLGQTFYEGPNDVHTIGYNASRTKPAKFLVVLLKGNDKPVRDAGALTQAAQMYRSGRAPSEGSHMPLLENGAVIVDEGRAGVSRAAVLGFSERGAKVIIIASGAAVLGRSSAARPNTTGMISNAPASDDATQAERSCSSSSPSMDHS